MKTPNAFTVGVKRGYDQSIKEKDTFKIGAQVDYEGGWVWRTEAEAREFLGSEMKYDFGQGPVLCDVYGLVLPNCWDSDVSVNPASDGVHRLLKDSLLLKISE